MGERAGHRGQAAARHPSYPGARPWPHDHLRGRHGRARDGAEAAGKRGALFARVSEAVAEGIYDWNIADNTLYVSERVMEIFGFEGQLTSYDWNSRVHPEDAEAYRAA